MTDAVPIPDCPGPTILNVPKANIEHDDLPKRFGIFRPSQQRAISRFALRSRTSCDSAEVLIARDGSVACRPPNSPWSIL